MKWLWGIFLILMIGCLASAGPKEGDLAPNFTLNDVDGRRHQLAEYGNSVVLLHFWVDYCANCRSEFPKMQHIYQQLKPEGLEIVAVNVGQSRAHVIEFQDNYDITFPMLMDPDYNVAKIYQAMAFPITFVINREGKIVKRVLGWMDETQVRYYFSAAK